eukprot:scaffold434_cov186-Pinguiococcus_pyrenoidosus.AAC.73
MALWRENGGRFDGAPRPCLLFIAAFRSFEASAILDYFRICPVSCKRISLDARSTRAAISPGIRTTAFLCPSGSSRLHWLLMNFTI